MRFIPALTGNTDAVGRLAPGEPVYPRTHGEHHRGTQHHQIQYGLSPHSRGTRKLNRILFPRMRFIPALTGNT